MLNMMKFVKVPNFFDEKELNKSNPVINVGSFSNLRVPTTRSVILSKIITCEREKIDIEVEVPRIIDFISSNEIIISKCIEVILDNSIKIAKECTNPYLKIKIDKRNKLTTCTIESNYNGRIKDYERIINEVNASNDREIGLYDVKNLLAYEPNVIFDFGIKDKVINQTLYIQTFYTI